jgi:hypothetical protein
MPLAHYPLGEVYRKYNFVRPTTLSQLCVHDVVNLYNPIDDRREICYTISCW